MPSRMAINGSHFIPAREHTGRITEIAAPFNFSVGHAGHAGYFASTFEGKTILIEFFLDKKAWTEWKVRRSGPQVARLGPSPRQKDMTLNDVTTAGVKYEIQESAAVDEFFKTVIVTQIPAVITKQSKELPPKSETLELDVARLKKASGKLKEVLNQLRSEHEAQIGPEIAQLEESERVLAALAEEKELDYEKFYAAISLTKNALHSARRKTEEQLAEK